MSEPACFTDWMKIQLEKSLAAQPSDQARIVHLAKEFGSWTQRYRNFAATGKQPFGDTPHPVYGDMTAFDFLAVLSMIDGARAVIERRMQAVPA